MRVESRPVLGVHKLQRIGSGRTHLDCSLVEGRRTGPKAGLGCRIAEVALVVVVAAAGHSRMEVAEGDNPAVVDSLVVVGSLAAADTAGGGSRPAGHNMGPTLRSEGFALKTCAERCASLVVLSDQGTER